MLEKNRISDKTIPRIWTFQKKSNGEWTHFKHVFFFKRYAPVNYNNYTVIYTFILAQWITICFSVLHAAKLVGASVRNRMTIILTISKRMKKSFGSALHQLKKVKNFRTNFISTAGKRFRSHQRNRKQMQASSRAINQLHNRRIVWSLITHYL